MRIARYLTTDHSGAYDGIDFIEVNSQIADDKGGLTFQHAGIMVPSTWGSVASDILAKKYFRKSGVARALRRVEEAGMPAWLWRSVPDLAAMSLLDPADRFGGETDARQVFDRIAGATTYWGWKGRYFSTEADAKAFHDEICRMLASQLAAPNSPQWFNTGLHWAYGLEGLAQGHHYVDASGQMRCTDNAFERPQTHSCFIQTVDDDLVNHGGILPLFVDEARIAKFGSGTGANFSSIRGADEGLSGGGKACGLISVLQAGDRSASLVTANGSTRRSSKMVIVDVDHPDIEAFVSWKANEERKVASLITGSRTCAHHLSAIMQALAAGEPSSFDPAINLPLRRAIRAARKAHVPENYIQRAVQFGKQGFTSFAFPIYNSDWTAEAYATVSGQNANNTIRMTDDFLRAVEHQDHWNLIARRDRSTIKSLPAADLWEDIGHAVWASADPGIHFATTINDWHTCPAAGDIRASNSCSEFLFLDDTGATLASLNLMRFKTEAGDIDLVGYEHACRLWTIALEISVSMAQYPSTAIAQRTHDYRPLGLGYANLGGLLMGSGIAYDSDAGRAICGGLTAILSGVAYATSAEMAAELGPFQGYAANRDAMLRVMRNHGLAACGRHDGYEGLATTPVALDIAALGALASLGGAAIAERAAAVWHSANALGALHGFRNAQASCLAPTGTIGLVMDCDTTGIEPDFALVKFKKLAAGGYFKIINRGVPNALRTLGYDEATITAIEHYAIGHGSLRDAPSISHADLAQRGFTAEKIEAIERALPMAFDIQFVFNSATLGADFLCDVLKVPGSKLVEGLDLLRFLGFSKAEIEAANVHVCGAMTIEGAPNLKEEHLSIFDCANPCGRTGTRYLTFESHIRMMAAAQPFLSGAISKTVNMPNEATVDDCKNAYMLSWKLGLKANALYRDGSKLSQPLSAHRLLDDEENEVEELSLETPNASIPDQIRRIAQDAADELLRDTVERPDRLLPVRPGLRHVAVVDGQRVTLQTRLTGSGRPAEVRIDAIAPTGRHNQIANDIAVAISVGLQHGVPLEQYVSAFTASSLVGGPFSMRGKSASAIVEHVFQHLGIAYLGRHDGQDGDFAAVEQTA